MYNGKLKYSKSLNVVFQFEYFLLIICSSEYTFYLHICVYVRVCKGVNIVN